MNNLFVAIPRARNFCDPTTGEVLQRIPEELMNKQRAAKLARGVPGRRNERIETYATWFVFLSDDFRDQVLAKWRKAKLRAAAKHHALPVTPYPLPRGVSPLSASMQRLNRSSGTSKGTSV